MHEALRIVFDQCMEVMQPGSNTGIDSLNRRAGSGTPLEGWELQSSPWRASTQLAGAREQIGFMHPGKKGDILQHEERIINPAWFMLKTLLKVYGKTPNM